MTEQASTIITLGRTLAEQYQREPVSVSPWQELLTSRGFPEDKLEGIKAALLRMADGAPDSNDPDEQPGA